MCYSRIMSPECALSPRFAPCGPPSDLLPPSHWPLATGHFPLTPYPTTLIYPEAQTVSESKGATPRLSPLALTLTVGAHPKSFPCHSYELLGGGGYPPRVHNSFIRKDLAFRRDLVRDQCSLVLSEVEGSVFISGSVPLNPYPPPFTRPREAKSLRAIIYVFTPPLSPCPPPFTKSGGWGRVPTW